MILGFCGSANGGLYRYIYILMARVFWKMGSMSGLHGLVYLPFQEWVFHVDNYRSSISLLVPIRLQCVKSDMMLSCLNHESVLDRNLTWCGIEVLIK